MAAATLLELIDAIEDYLTAELTDVYAYSRWEGSAQYPAVVPMVPTIPDYQQTFDRTSSRLRTVEIDLWILAGPMEPARVGAAQRILTELVDWDGDRSVYRALRADKTLGGAVAECIPKRFTLLGIEEMNVVNAWAGSLPCTVNLAKEP